MKFWKKFKDSFREAIAPSPRCMGCGVDVFDDGGFCPNCLQQVVFNNGKTCKRCGVALHGAEDYCSYCSFEKVYFDQAFSPLSYEGMVQKALLDMKFRNLAVNAKVFAQYLVQAAQKHNLQFDVVTFVPMTTAAAKKRGYNQAQLLAEHFCDILQIDAPLCALTKTKETARQEQLNRLERKENLIGAFAADETVKGKRVLLIDDIKTTGSTLNECAKALKRKGATQVLCLTVASREEKTAWELEEDV